MSNIDGPDGEDRGVRRRRPFERPLDQHPAGRREQAAEKDDEGDVFERVDVDEVVPDRAAAELDEGRNDEGRRPERRDLPEVVVPKLRRDQREDRDA
jgi:hypothetical protein